jgi:predicted lysophospholipase L1 biosynthesis ABC-type transport system permease subunit
VIGVVEDVKQSDYRQESSALLYYPLAGPTPTSWVLSSPAYVVRTPRAETIAPEIRELVRTVAPEAPMYRTFTMAELAADSMVQLSFTMLTLGLVSTLALVLGAVGLYGVLSYIVALRRKEIGIRMALGARPEQAARLALGQALRLKRVGGARGVAASHRL